MKNNINDFVLASLISSYPEKEFKTYIGALLGGNSLTINDKLRSLLEKHSSNEDAVDSLRSKYIELFDHSKSINPLYETEYGRARAMFKANELSDIAAFYKAFGFEVEGVEMLDHIAVELEFYGVMKMKLNYLSESKDSEGVEIVKDGMKKFLKDHLGRFSKSIIARPGIQGDEFYSNTFQFISDLVEEECRLFDLKVEPIEWLASEKEEMAISCGGSVAGLN